MIYEMGDACSRKLYYSGELNDSRKLRAASKLSSSLTCSQFDYIVFVLMSLGREKKKQKCNFMTSSE